MELPRFWHHWRNAGRSDAGGVVCFMLEEAAVPADLRAALPAGARPRSLWVGTGEGNAARAWVIVGEGANGEWTACRCAPDGDGVAQVQHTQQLGADTLEAAHRARVIAGEALRDSLYRTRFVIRATPTLALTGRAVEPLSDALFGTDA